jgi:hypothetical protein
LNHRKFRKLARGLHSRALAVGSLELLWAVANDSGDAFLGSSEDVEDIADWRGESGALTALLVSCGFLDALGDDGFVVHDHEHHAPSYVVRRREREEQRRIKGLTISELRRKAAKARWGMPPANGMQVDANEFHLQTRCDANDTTPISHLPSPVRTTPLTPLAGGTRKPTKRELEKASAYRTNVHAMRCPHTSPCATATDCIHLIALTLRGH